MKNLVFILLLSGASLAMAEEFQLGVVVGSTSGLSGKYSLQDNRAIAGAMSYAFDARHGISLQLDYLFDKRRQFNLGEVSPLNLYYGLGLRTLNITSGGDNGKTRLGVRAPVGINFQTQNPNLEFFGELAPVLDVAPSTNVYIDIALGVRIRF